MAINNINSKTKLGKLAKKLQQVFGIKNRFLNFIFF